MDWTRNPLNLAHGQTVNSDPLAWKRTGKITMRADDYLIIRFSTGYTALHGPQCAREILGQGIETSDAAKAICDQHRQKNSGAT